MNKVAKNMDSVFADSKEELDLFDIMFDDDDTIIDTVNGIDKNGTPLTGPDPEDLYKSQGKENNDPIQDKNDPEQRAGKAKESDKKVDGEDQESIQAATEAGDIKFDNKLGAGKFVGLKLDIDALENDAKLKLGLETAEAGEPLVENDPEERDGVEVPDGTVSTEAEELDKDDKVENLEDEIDKESDVVKEDDDTDLDDDDVSEIDDGDWGDDDDDDIDSLIDSASGASIANEADDIVDADDAEQRAGKVKPSTKDVDGEDQDRIDNVSESDDIVDAPDKAQRAGEVVPDSTEVDGENQDQIDNVSNECGDTCTGDNCEGNLDKDIDEYLTGDTVPDDIKVNEADDPIADADDAEQRAGKEKPATDNVDGEDQEKIDNVSEADAPLDDLCDAGQRAGKVKPDDDNVEGEDQELIDNVDESDILSLAIGESDDDNVEVADDDAETVDECGDPISDADDAEQRAGKAKPCTKEVEGEDQESIQAATESDIDSLLKEDEEVAGDEIDDEVIEDIEGDDDTKADIDLTYDDDEDNELLNIAIGEDDE